MAYLTYTLHRLTLLPFMRTYPTIHLTHRSIPLERRWADSLGHQVRPTTGFVAMGGGTARPQTAIVLAKSGDSHRPEPDFEEDTFGRFS